VGGIQGGLQLQLFSLLNSQLGHHMQFANFCVDCFEFNSGPPYSGVIGNYES
jgi:hypothetical protein